MKKTILKPTNVRAWRLDKEPHDVGRYVPDPHCPTVYYVQINLDGRDCEFKLCAKEPFSNLKSKRLYPFYLEAPLRLYRRWFRVP